MILQDCKKIKHLPHPAPRLLSQVKDFQIFSRTVLSSNPSDQSQPSGSLGDPLGQISEFPFGDLQDTRLGILQCSPQCRFSRRWDIRGSHTHHRVHPVPGADQTNCQNDFCRNLFSLVIDAGALHPDHGRGTQRVC